MTRFQLLTLVPLSGPLGLDSLSFASLFSAAADTTVLEHGKPRMEHVPRSNLILSPQLRRTRLRPWRSRPAREGSQVPGPWACLFPVREKKDRKMRFGVERGPAYSPTGSDDSPESWFCRPLCHEAVKIPSKETRKVRNGAATRFSRQPKARRVRGHLHH